LEDLMMRVVNILRLVTAVTLFLSANAGRTAAEPARLAAKNPEAVLRVETDAKLAQVPFMSWDTEGGDRAKMNLLREPMKLRILDGDVWRVSSELPTQAESLDNGGVRYRITTNKGADVLEWKIQPARDRLTMTISCLAIDHNVPVFAQPTAQKKANAELLIPFDPRATATTVLASQWLMDGTLRLPAIVSAPDFGQMLLSCDRPSGYRARLEGDRQHTVVDLLVELPQLRTGEKYQFALTPVWLPVPKGLKDQSLWPAARRGWFNIYQPAATHLEGVGSANRTPGVLANNVISNRVVSLMQLYADHALLVPDAVPGVSFTSQVRRTLDWCLDERTNEAGEVTPWGEFGPIMHPTLDAGAAPLISAWGYVEATGDKTWLAWRIQRLESIADYLAKCDADGDGLVEISYSGNYGGNGYVNSAYDAVSSGYKDGYSNALVYRAWRCLADLEKQLGRGERQARYDRLADRLQAAYVPTLYNPATGWLAWWKSADGELHDYACPFISSIAIAYGLMDPAQGREVLARFWEKIDKVGFTRFDLGIPCTLVPIRKGDYHIGSNAAPQREDGSDTFENYLNGGCLVHDTIYFLAAHYTVGENEKADRILRAMLDRQLRGVFPNGGGFQNGVIDRSKLGAEFFDWNGDTCGYEGYLTYSFSFLQAVFLREPEFRARLFRPLIEKTKGAGN
jgi:hypothetical protein